MSGHSKWTQIKRQKGAADLKKGALFSKLSNAITIAARQGGSNPQSNFKLKLAIEQAKAANMPKENIERAIKKGTGGDSEMMMEEITYEGFGLKGLTFILEVVTDNKNRASSNIKSILNQYHCSLGGANSVLWMFERRGLIRIIDYQSKITDLEGFQLEIIDSGAEDIKIQEKDLVIFTTPENLQKIKEDLEKQNIIPDYAQIEWVAKENIKIEDSTAKEKIEELFQELDECEDVQDYYTNIDL